MRAFAKVLFAGLVILADGLLLAWMVHRWQSFAVAALLAVPMLLEIRYRWLR